MCQTTVERLFDRMWPSQIRKVASLFAQALSLRFNQEEFCDELYIHRKSPRLLSSRIQAAVFMAG
jgi:hypothetical protein